MKSVIDTTLEQRAILAVGWLRKAGRLTAQKTISVEELPQGLEEPASAYIREQYALAHEAVDSLMLHVIEINDQAAEQIKACQRQRNEIAALAGAGKKTAAEANRDAHLLAEQTEADRAAIGQSEYLLRILRGQEEMPLPTLPLFKYAQALEGLEDGDVNTRSASQTNTSLPLRSKLFQGFLRRTDRSDRIALSIAFILCFTVIATALYYVFFWGTVDIKVTPLEDASLQVLCTNSTWNSILLEAPYGGDGLPNEPVTHYGLLLELLDADGNTTRPLPLETLWRYKDNPAHLHGPIIIGPLFAAELDLDLKTYAQEAEITALRLTLFRAPNKKYKTFEVMLPEAFWDLGEEKASNFVITK